MRTRQTWASSTRAVHGSSALLASPRVRIRTAPLASRPTQTTRWLSTRWSCTGMWYVMICPTWICVALSRVSMTTSPGLMPGAMLPVSIVAVR